MEDAFAMHVSWEVFHDDGYQIHGKMENPIDLNEHISVNKIPAQDQLRDFATKPQLGEGFVSQRESLMQWRSECTTKEELSLPAQFDGKMLSIHRLRCAFSKNVSSELDCGGQTTDCFFFRSYAQ
jgi:hypothetical protein